MSDAVKRAVWQVCLQLMETSNCEWLSWEKAEGQGWPLLWQNNEREEVPEAHALPQNNQGWRVERTQST